MIRILCLLVLLALPLAARADQPRYTPRRDVAVVYSTAGSEFALPARITLRYFAVADRIRLDANGGPYVLLDRTVERVDLVLPDARLAMELPPGAGMTQGFVLGAGLNFRRIGSANVLGRSCTTYEVTLENRHAAACITADGLVLRGEGSDPSGKAVRVEAVSVNFAPQPAGLFSPPDTYRYVQLPH
jgi:hypothetical protein